MGKQQHRGIVHLGANRYEIRARATCPRSGKRKEARREVVCSGIKEARAELQKLREELDERIAGGEIVKPERVTLRTFAISWLDGRLASGKLKPSAASKIASVLDLHVLPVLGDLYLDAITPTDVEDWLKGQREKRYAAGKGRHSKRKGAPTRAYSPLAILGHFRVLRAVARAARVKLRLPHAFTDGVETPAAIALHDDNALDAVQLGRVLQAVAKLSPAWYPAVLLDVTTGLRWGELSGLRWDDVREDERIIIVRRGNWKGREVATTKTGAVKAVPLLPVVADALREHRQRMVAAQHPGLAAGWIFPTGKGSLHRGSPLRKVLGPALREAGITHRVTPHGLRHSANDLLRRVAGGEVVRAILGHATPLMTLHYSHVDEDEKQTAASRAFSGVLGGVGKGVATGVAVSEASDGDRVSIRDPGGAARI